MVKTTKNESTSDNNKDFEQTGFLTVFLTTFTTVFLAELGDKTQIATLLLSAQSGRPLVVFAGSALALIASSLVGVILGRWLAKTVPPQRLQYIAGIFMVGIGCLLGIQATHTMIQSFTSS